MNVKFRRVSCTRPITFICKLSVSVPLHFCGTPVSGTWSSSMASAVVLAPLDLRCIVDIMEVCSGGTGQRMLVGGKLKTKLS